MEKRDKVIGIVVILAIAIAAFALVATISGQRNVEVPSGYYAIYYLVPDNSSAAYCNETTVEVWVNSTVDFFGGHFYLTIDPSCGNFVVGSYVQNRTYFDMPPSIITDTESVLEVEYVNSTYTVQPPGVYHIGSFRIHGNSTICCITNISFRPNVPWTYITNTTGNINTALDNGTFRCGAPTITVDKKVYDPATGHGWIRLTPQRRARNTCSG